MEEELLIEMAFAVIGIAMGVFAGELALKLKMRTSSALLIAVVTGRFTLIINGCHHPSPGALAPSKAG